MTIPGVTYSNSKKRLFAVFINVVIFIIVGFLLNYWLSNYTFNSWTGYTSKTEEYAEVVKDYKAKQDEYGLIYYDENNTRHYKTDVDEATLTAFKADPVVAELISKQNTLEPQLVGLLFASYTFFYVIGSLLLTIIFAVCFGKYLNIGYLLTGQKLIDETGGKPKKNKIVLYSLARWALLVPLGICSILLIPVYFLYQIIYREHSLTKLEEHFKLYCVLGSDL